MSKRTSPTRATLPMNHKFSIKHDLSLLWVVLVWGFNIPIMKIVFRTMHPFVMNIFRLWIAATILGILHYLYQRRIGQPFFAPVRTYPWQLLTVGIIGFLCYQYFSILGIDGTTAGNAALILSSAPLWTVIVALVLGLERMLPLDWLGIFTTFTGALIIVLGGAQSIDFSDTTLWGNILMVIASISWGAYTALNRTLTQKINPAGIAFFALVMMLPLLTLLGVSVLDSVVWDDVGVEIWLLIAYSGAFSIGLNLALWTRSVRNVGPAHTAVYANLVPVVTLVTGYYLLGEAITLVQIGGGALIIGGLLIMRYNRAQHLRAVGVR